MEISKTCYLLSPFYTSVTMFEWISELVIHPDAFFARVSQEKINLIPPLAIVGAGMLLIFLAMVLPIAVVVIPSHALVGFLGFRGLLLHFLILTSIPLVIWGIISFGLYIISRALGGAGSLTATIQNIGYGMGMWCVFGIGLMIDSSFKVFMSYKITLPSGEIGQVAGSNPFLGIILIIDLAAFFWGWYLWILAVKHTHGFTIWKAAAVSIVPVMIAIWFTILRGIDTIRILIFGM